MSIYLFIAEGMLKDWLDRSMVQAQHLDVLPCVGQ